MNAVYFLIAGLAGLLAHYMSKRWRHEIKGSIVKYLFIDSPGLTAATILALIAADFAAVAVGGLEDMKLTTAVAAGFTAGWTVDSAIAQGQPQ